MMHFIGMREIANMSYAYAIRKAALTLKPILSILKRRQRVATMNVFESLCQISVGHLATKDPECIGIAHQLIHGLADLGPLVATTNRIANRAESGRRQKPKLFLFLRVLPHKAFATPAWCCHEKRSKDQLRFSPCVAIEARYSCSNAIFSRILPCFEGSSRGCH